MMPGLAAAGTVFGCWINGGRITMAVAERWNISYGALILGSKEIMTVSEVYISGHATAQLTWVILQAIMSLWRCMFLGTRQPTWLASHCGLSTVGEVYNSRPATSLLAYRPLL